MSTTGPNPDGESTATQPTPESEFDQSARVRYRHLSSFQQAMCRIIAAEGPMHGLAVKDALDAERDEDVHHGRLYPNLDTIVEQGFVEKGQFDARTNSYELTERGRRVVESEIERNYDRVVGDGGGESCQ